jgi:hypothetical protein
MKTIFPVLCKAINLVSPIYFSESAVLSPSSKKPVVFVLDVAPQIRFFQEILVPFVEYRTNFDNKKFI